MEEADCPPYKAAGLAYIRFAREERELFKLLFMRDRTGEPPGEDGGVMEAMTALVSAGTGLDRDRACRFHLEMWICVHGIAAMIATAYLEWDREMIGEMLTDTFEGLKERYRKKGEGK